MRARASKAAPRGDQLLALDLAGGSRSAVGINAPIPVPMAYFYTRAKAITARWPDPRHRGVDLGFPTNR